VKNIFLNNLEKNDTADADFYGYDTEKSAI
jgi:hypothetical protein